MARLHRDVLQVLVADIVGGVYETGEQLPRETDLVEQFGVSRGVVRETIRALEERNLVAVKHGKGATVRPSTEWDFLDVDVLGAVLESPEGSELLSEYLECRQILEVEAAGLAAERATPADLQRISEALERMEESAAKSSSAAGEELFHQADLAFHAALIASTGNRALAGLITHIHRALLAARYATARPEYRRERALPEHRAIYKAVAAGQPRAARKAMSDHLATIAGYLQEYAADKSAAPAR